MAIFWMRSHTFFVSTTSLATTLTHFSYDADTFQDRCVASDSITF